MSHISPLDYARENRERFLDELKELLRIPSISTLSEHREDMERAARFLRDRLSAIGFEAETIAGHGHPLVYGQWLNAPGRPTVLLYGHYDVQPVDPIDLWQTPPFEPDVRDDNIYARGAADDKGQTMTFLHAAESLLHGEGRLPLNLKIIIEGEEECGGAAIKAYVSEHGGRLAADVVQVADSGMYAPGIPTIETGLRGIVYTEIHAQGASHDLHSGLYGGVGPNPLNALAWVIADLKDRKGHIAIPGFYDDVQRPADDVLASWRKLPFDLDAYRAQVGARDLVGMQEFSPLERTWSRPTLDVHGISGGFTGEGAKTVIPAEATAKVSMRLVPDQRAEKVFELFRNRVLELTPPGIDLRVRLIHGDDPVLVPERGPFIDAARQALQQTFGRPAVLARSGGSIPIVGVFKETLGLNTVLMGWGLPDDNLHAPNEKFSLENFYLGIDATVRFWQAVGALAEQGAT
ncbi:MAG: dipeptidase [Chloroflexi bacterium]|nr:MAG: dipeptidase [Chloroflexota bacterium]